MTLALTENLQNSTPQPPPIKSAWFDQAEKTSKSTEASNSATYGAPTKAMPYVLLLGQVTAETELEMFDLAPPSEVSQKVQKLEWVHHASQQAAQETADRRSYSKSIRPWLIAISLSVVTALGTITAMAGLSTELKTSLILPLVTKMQSVTTSAPTSAMVKPPILAEKFQGRLHSIDAPPPVKPGRTLTEAPKRTTPTQPAPVLPMKVSSRFQLGS